MVTSKYTVTKNDGGDFLPGEPLFVVRARDAASIYALEGYIDRLPDGDYRRECNAILKSFYEWRAANTDHWVKPWEKTDAFDPTNGGKKLIEPDDDFDDVILERPQVCNLAECESCQ